MAIMDFWVRWRVPLQAVSWRISLRAGNMGMGVVIMEVVAGVGNGRVG